MYVIDRVCLVLACLLVGFACKGLLILFSHAPHAGTELMSAVPLQTPFDKKKAAAVGLRKWVRFAKNGDTTIMQVRHLACHAMW